MADMILRVTAEELEKSAGAFSEIVKDIRKRMDQILSVSSKTRAYWRGEAGDRDREGYASFQEDINYVIQRLEEHPRDLLSMAGIYHDVESDAVAEAAALKTDVIA